MQANELQKYIGNLIFKFPIHTEVRISGKNFQALIIFHPDVSKTNFIRVKKSLCEEIFGHTLYDDFILPKKVKCNQYMVIHLVKKIKKVRVPIILVTT